MGPPTGLPSATPHNRAVLSSPPVNTVFQSGLIAAATNPPFPIGAPIGEPSEAFQSRAAAPLTVSIVLPSGLYAPKKTSPGSLMVTPIGEPSETLQSRMVLARRSSILFPSRLDASLAT